MGLNFYFRTSKIDTGDFETVSGLNSFADLPKSNLLKLVLGLGVLVTAFVFLVLYLTPINCTENIAGGTITVNAGSYVYYQFTVPSRAYNVMVQVNWFISGGGETNIMVYIMDSTNFINWQNGRGASAIISSRQATRDFIGGTLPSGGTYFLVLDNTFSVTSQKNLIIGAILTYEQPRF